MPPKGDVVSALMQQARQGRAQAPAPSTVISWRRWGRILSRCLPFAANATLRTVHQSFDVRLMLVNSERSHCGGDAHHGHTFLGHPGRKRRANAAQIEASET